MQHGDGLNRFAGLLLSVFIVLIFIFTISSLEPVWSVFNLNISEDRVVLSLNTHLSGSERGP